MNLKLPIPKPWTDCNSGTGKLADRKSITNLSLGITSFFAHAYIVWQTAI